MESAPIYPLIELATVLNNGDAVSTINQIAVAISSSPDHHEEARQLLETAIQDSTPENALEIIEDMLSVADVSLPLICASESDHFPFWLAYLLNMAKMVPEGVEEHPDPTTDSLLINNALHILSDAVLVPTVLSTELATHIIHQTKESKLGEIKMYPHFQALRFGDNRKSKENSKLTDRISIMRYKLQSLSDESYFDHQPVSPPLFGNPPQSSAKDNMRLLQRSSALLAHMRGMIESLETDKPSPQ
eukprot:gnl/Dysnectes_brevis/3080_a3826_1290.p1 GENE.gnl/Dysnectes_brevis/3080_a3826_1290~~gnl/Dysnectes_brevis/3080_a3826_1290.p1  ORF type:complete len:246 (+),score=17.49 gnl/Dysnectes_brevis/3080_a3826_1290:64-801(+)